MTHNCVSTNPHLLFKSRRCTGITGENPPSSKCAATDFFFFFASYQPAQLGLSVGRQLASQLVHSHGSQNGRNPKRALYPPTLANRSLTSCQRTILHSLVALFILLFFFFKPCALTRRRCAKPKSDSNIDGAGAFWFQLASTASWPGRHIYTRAQRAKKKSQHLF